jgi:protein-S-isoprenylcysteine O-methyltransferase Ste14
VTPASIPQPAAAPKHSDTITSLGGWLFKQRTWLPVPLILALLVIPTPDRTPSLFWLGCGIVAAGELLRFWAVRHIGVISRTRSDRLGPLVAAGPFARVRNPLYIGNIALWSGIAVSAQLLWLVPAVALLLGLEYHAIIRWEERLLETRLGDSYRAYATRVPRWIPRWKVRGESNESELSTRKVSWPDVLFSERGTLIAIGVGYVLLYMKGKL